MTAVATGMLMMLLGVSQITQAQDSTGAEKKKVIKTKHVRIEVYDRANGQTDTMVREYVIEDDATGDKLRMEQMEQMELQVQQLEAQREKIEENAHQQEIDQSIRESDEFVVSLRERSPSKLTPQVA